MPGTPSRRVFGLFNVYRFILAILIAWVVMEAPHYHVSLSIGWPLVAFLLVYDAILWILSRVVDFVTYGTLLSLIAMALDTLLAALILLQFAFPTNTDSPVLLPLLAFEGWAYWNWVGGLLVTMATELLLLGTWFYQKAIGHAAFSPALLVFWAAVLLIIGLVPVSISWVTNEHPLGTLLPQPTPASPPTTDALDTLTEREREIYQYLKAGKTLPQIAKLCTIEYGTVKTHVRHIYRKLGVSARKQLP
jgi:DNA-binding CsgD family transcriptional regulator